MAKQIISSFSSRNDFMNLLKSNPGLIIIKFGATWCGPCKAITPVLEGFFATSPPNVICADVDVDESFDLYAFMKSKKMVNGIPAILMYRRGNTSFAPNDSVTGADPTALHNFFKRCGNHLVEVEKLYSIKSPISLSNQTVRPQQNLNTPVVQLETESTQVTEEVQVIPETEIIKIEI